MIPPTMAKKREDKLLMNYLKNRLLHPNKFSTNSIVLK